MKYVLMIYHGEAQVNAMSDAQKETINNEYLRMAGEWAGRGVMRGGEILMPVAMATTVRVREGELLVTDGPFAETKEQFAGYYILELANIDEAIDAVRQLPVAAFGSVEVRPLVDFTAPGRP